MSNEQIKKRKMLSKFHIFEQTQKPPKFVITCNSDNSSPVKLAGEESQEQEKSMG
jgi:hypothetical protein